MSCKQWIGQSTGDHAEQMQKLKIEIKTADAVLIGAGAGLSAAAGLSYGGERFTRYFADFKEKYHMNDMYAGGFYPYESLEEYWAWWSRHIYYNRYEAETNDTYLNLLSLVKDKDYFVLTTNVDHQFQLAGFDAKRLFYTQGDYGLWQCSLPCHQQTYDNETVVRRMVAEQSGLRIPTALIPYCPRCGRPLTMNLRCDASFVQEEGWYAAYQRYENFLRRHRGVKLILLELGVGGNTPVIIKYPFWQMTAEHPSWFYVCINLEKSPLPREIAARSLSLNADLAAILSQLAADK